MQKRHFLTLLDLTAGELKTLTERAIELNGRAVEMTASFGVAMIAGRDSTLTDIIVRADRALYRSKRAGRNRVAVRAEVSTGRGNPPW